MHHRKSPTSILTPNTPLSQPSNHPPFIAPPSNLQNSLFQLQLRPIHDPVGPPRRLLPQTQRRALPPRDQDGPDRMGESGEGNGEDREGGRGRRR